LLHARFEELNIELANNEVVGRIFKVNAAPVGTRMWTLAFGYHEDRTPTHGYAATRASPWLERTDVGYCMVPAQEGK
jgi:hypothetical protein